MTTPAYACLAHLLGVRIPSRVLAHEVGATVGDLVAAALDDPMGKVARALPAIGLHVRSATQGRRLIGALLTDAPAELWVGSFCRFPMFAYCGSPWPYNWGTVLLTLPGSRRSPGPVAFMGEVSRVVAITDSACTDAFVLQRQLDADASDCLRLCHREETVP